MATKKETNESTIYDVIIFGAGLSGLSAGYYLLKGNKKLKILVIEAKDRVGGRTQTVELKCSDNGKKNRWDAGGQWVTNTQLNITKLIEEFKLETHTQYDKGTNILETNGKLIKYASHIPRINLISLLDLQRMLFKINGNANKIKTMNPFLKIDQAKSYDQWNLDQFLYTNSFSKVARSIVDAAIRTVYGLEPNEINTLFGLMYVKSGGSIEALTLTDPNCAQEKRVKGGTQQISQNLVDAILRNKNNALLLNRPIVFVDQTNSNFVSVTAKNIQTNQEEIYYARKIVSSIPLNQYIKIGFKPELPLFKKNVLNSCKMGNYMKILVTYKSAFWRKKGYSGAVVSDGSIVFHKDVKYEKLPKNGPLAIVYDATNEENEAALVGFVAAQSAVEWLDQDSSIRRKEVIEALIRYFGIEAGNYIEYYEKNWSSEPFTGGCPTVNVIAPGVMKDYVRATREPYFNIHFCGTETATNWQGYMDGAVESGIRAANEILHDSYRDYHDVTYDYEKTYYYQRDQIEKLNPKYHRNTKSNILEIFFIGVLLIFLTFVFKLFTFN